MCPLTDAPMTDQTVYGKPLQHNDEDTHRPGAGRHARGFKGGDPYGFKGSQGTEVEAIDWTLTIYSVFMMALSIANVALPR